MFRKNDQDESAFESKYSPDEWLKRAEDLLPQGAAGMKLMAQNSPIATAFAVISLTYEQRRTNELLEQLLAK